LVSVLIIIPLIGDFLDLGQDFRERENLLELESPLPEGGGRKGL